MYNVVSLTVAYTIHPIYLTMYACLKVGVGTLLQNSLSVAILCMTHSDAWVQILTVQSTSSSTSKNTIAVAAFNIWPLLNW